MDNKEREGILDLGVYLGGKKLGVAAKCESLTATEFRLRAVEMIDAIIRLAARKELLKEEKDRFAQEIDA